MKVRIVGPTEDQLHVSVAHLLDWVLQPPAFYTTFPAGRGKLSGWMAQLLKKSGLKAGMPDILVFHAGSCWGIELKVAKNVLSKDQRDTIVKLRAAGVHTYVCRSVEDVMICLINMEVPLRNVRVGDATWRPSPKSEQLVEIYARPVDTGEGDADDAGNRTRQS